MVPLLEVRQVKPSLLLRDETTGRAATGSNRRNGGCRGRARRARVVAGGLDPGGRHRDRRIHRAHDNSSGRWLVLTRMTRPLARSSWFPLRQAVLHLSRPGNQTRVILLTVGLGTFFIMGVRGLQVNLLNQFALQIGENTPDMFLVDIQQDQAADMKAFLAERLPRESQPLLIPVLRARVTGKGVNLDEVKTCRAAAGCRANTRSPTAASSSRTRPLCKGSFQPEAGAYRNGIRGHARGFD